MQALVHEKSERWYKSECLTRLAAARMVLPTQPVDATGQSQAAFRAASKQRAKVCTWPSLLP